ncbi:DnaA/Hda family protein [Bdellovibrionota bacterium FG-2]
MRVKTLRVKDRVEKSKTTRRCPHCNWALVKPERRSPSGLISKYSFDKFRKTQGNQFAWNAARNVIAHPGKSFQPFIVCGKSKVGKTHLLHAIGNQVMAENPEAQVCYVSGESLRKAFERAIKGKMLPMLRNKLQNDVDFLLIDDFQQILGNKVIEEEVYRMLRANRRAERQLVIACNVAPKELNYLNKRIKSELESGLVTDVPVTLDKDKLM